MEKMLNETFSINLAKGATIQSASGVNTKALTDRKYQTYWTTRQSDTTAIINFTFNQPVTFDVLDLQENIAVGQRIEYFILEYKQNNDWKQVAEGTTVGYKRLMRFDPVTATNVRLRIISSRLNPTLSEFGLYHQPKK